MTRDPANHQDTNDVNSDLGFGSYVARASRQRLLNRDGSFNVRREGLSLWEAVPLYHLLLTMSWPKFLALLVAGFLIMNALFATAYLACGPQALVGLESKSLSNRFADEFFFSVHTLSTIGYGSMSPRTLAANVVVTIESIVGLLGLAIIAGIVFARFSRPQPKILFSRVAVLAPYREHGALMFRLANRRNNQLVDVEAKVLFTRRRHDDPDGKREFVPLRLEREKVVFFPLAWTVVHPIDDDSPLKGITDADLAHDDAELLVLINAFDDTLSQMVHARTSYKPGEIVVGARFANMFLPVEKYGVVSVDLEKIHEIERVDWPR